MRILITALTVLLFNMHVSAQSEKATYKTVAAQFDNLYNTGNYDSIYTLFSPEMKSALPKEKTVEFLTGLQAQAGRITRRDFVKYHMGTYALYKTTFERALLGVNISIDKSDKINGLFLKPFTDEALPKPERNTTALQLPVTGEWTVIWGGDTKEQNYHMESIAQKNAFDLVVTGNDGRSFRTDAKTNQDYYAFGKEILAPCDGEVVLVVDGIKDNKPGEMNPLYVPGNSVIIKTAKNEYLFFGHFQQRTVKVAEGQKVKKGQLLGLCGNSGNSSEPHLHFHIQNVEDMNVATGVKCYFENLVVNGQAKSEYSPVKNDKIKAQ